MTRNRFGTVIFTAAVAASIALTALTGLLDREQS